MTISLKNKIHFKQFKKIQNSKNPELFVNNCSKVEQENTYESTKNSYGNLSKLGSANNYFRTHQKLNDNSIIDLSFNNKLSSINFSKKVESDAVKFLNRKRKRKIQKFSSIYTRNSFIFANEETRNVYDNLMKIDPFIQLIYKKNNKKQNFIQKEIVKCLDNF